MTLAALVGNQVFAGVAGAAVVSAALYQLRSLPGLAWMLLVEQFSATLTVYSEQDAFRHIDLWLARHPASAKARRLGFAEWWDRAADNLAFELTPGHGPHLLWEDRQPIFVNKAVEAAQPGAGGPNRRQTLTLTTIGRSRAMLERIMDQARTVQDRDVVSIYVWGGHGYALIERRARRALDTIYLAEGLKERIVADAKRFADRKGWYAERGIPHRRGYLFEGPPGTGKSSMAFALAGEMRRSVYIINPSAVGDDTELQAAINQAGAGLVLIEDIDAIDCGQERKPKPASRLAPGDDPMVAAPRGTGISASGLLNAIDGVAARDGRILVITTNHADRLDAALLRPGRVDLRCEFDRAGADEAATMFGRFYPETDPAAFLAALSPDLPLSQAEIQNRLLRLAA